MPWTDSFMRRTTAIATPAHLCIHRGVIVAGEAWSTAEASFDVITEVLGKYYLRNVYLSGQIDR